jgi:hypothetical protein
MKKVFFISLIAIALTVTGCGDSKKKNLFPLSDSSPSISDTKTVTEPGGTPADTQINTDEQTGTTEQSGTGDNTQTAAQTGAQTGSGNNTQDSASSGSGDGTQPASAGGSQDSGQNAANNVPSDENKDKNSTSEFQYATINTVAFDLTIMNSAKEAVAKASIRVIEGINELSASISDEAGKAAFTSSINQTYPSVEIVVDHPDYISKTIKVDNIQDLSLISRIIYLEKKSAGSATQPEKVNDTDKDGVPDDTDQFPDDPALIAAVNNEYTIAFEDLYPNQGDADFNDLVVKFGITEYINPENKISKINIKSKVLAAGAGYKNQFWISVLGKDYQLISDPHEDTMNAWNSKKNDTFFDAPVHSLNIVYENPVSRTDIAPMPYDPYLKANGNEKNQVHLPFVTTKFVGKKLDTSKFPWAVLVPDEWLWPYEKTEIFKAYPDFKKWYESGGIENRDWFLKPNKQFTFPVPYDSAITAYLLKMKTSTKTAVISGLLGAMIVALIGINMWRRKKMKQ